MRRAFTLDQYEVCELSELQIRNARKMGITVAEAGERWATDYYAWVLRKWRRFGGSRCRMST